METFLTSPLCPFYLKDVFFHVFSLWWIWITLNIWIKLLINSVLPRQGLWSLTACLDALDLVAIHDEFILLTDLHVMLKFAVHGVVPFLNRRNLTKNEIQTHSSHKTILIAMEGNSIFSQSILHSVETTGRTTRIHCKQAASFDTQNILRQWTYQPHPPRPTWFPRGSGRKWPGSIWQSHITGITRGGKPICCESPAWKTMRPMRPNPLIPIFVASIFRVFFLGKLGIKRYKTHQNTMPFVESFGDPEFWPLKETAWDKFLHLALGIFEFFGEANGKPC